jgi:hypothetical protein
MKKDLIFTPILLVIGILLFLLRATGLAAHIGISIVGVLVLAVYTAATRKNWKFTALEVLMRVCYGAALIFGGVTMKVKDIAALAIVHKAAAAAFVVVLLALFVLKLTAKKRA